MGLNDRRKALAAMRDLEPIEVSRGDVLAELRLEKWGIERCLPDLYGREKRRAFRRLMEIREALERMAIAGRGRPGIGSETETPGTRPGV